MRALSRSPAWQGVSAQAPKPASLHGALSRAQDPPPFLHESLLGPERPLAQAPCTASPAGRQPKGHAGGQTGERAMGGEPRALWPPASAAERCSAKSLKSPGDELRPRGMHFSPQSVTGLNCVSPGARQVCPEVSWASSLPGGAPLSPLPPRYYSSPLLTTPSGHQGTNIFCY